MWSSAIWCNAELTPRHCVIGTLPDHVAEENTWKGVESWISPSGVPKREKDVMEEAMLGLEKNLKHVTEGHR